MSGLANLAAGAIDVPLESRFQQRDGRWVHLQWIVRAIPGTDLWWAAGRDTTSLQRLLADRLSLRAQRDLALGQATAAMWELDVTRGELTWEPAAADVFAMSADALPRNIFDLAQVVSTADGESVRAALEQLTAQGVVDVDVRLGSGSGTRHLTLRGRVLDRDRRGRAVRAVGLLLDTSADKAMEEQMLRMLMSDALTGVANRRGFDQALRAEWRRAHRAAEPLSVLMIDVDNFKSFNDTYGHVIGDDALCAVARALSGAVHREGDLVTRYGGEEFAVLLPGTDLAGATAVAGRMVRAVAGLTLRQAPGQSFGISVGHATWRLGDSTDTFTLLLSRADQALYEAKARGKNQAVSYERALAVRGDLEDAIAHGLTAGEFELFYQPITEIATGRAVGLEALMRWMRPGHGIVRPDEFIPIAEASDLICDLGRWALRTAASQLTEWTGQGLDPHEKLRVAVNVSARHVSAPRIVTDVHDALAVSGLAAHRLQLELTETAFADSPSVRTHLATISAMGSEVAIDDFGTGYTSVGQLPALPAVTLKIDRSFAASAEPSYQELVRLIIGPAHAFRLRVVAEGVEEQHDLQRLKQLDCDYVQGYLISRPMPASDVPGWLASST